MSKYLAEFLATFALICVIGFGHSLLLLVATLVIIIAVTLPFSGCNINPAVSLGLCLTKQMSKKQFALYVLVQMLAAECAAEVIVLVNGKQFSIQPGSGVPWLSALLMETVMTFLLVMVIFLIVEYQTNRKKVKKSQLSSVQVGLIFASFIFVVASIAGPISGAALNPAVGLAALLPIFVHQGGGATAALWSNWLLYFLGPLAGAIFAKLFWNVGQKYFSKILGLISS